MEPRVTMEPSAAYYREFLRTELTRRCRKNPRYSLRAYAKGLAIDVAALSRVLAGKGALSLKSAERVVRVLGCTAQAKRLFLDSVAKDLKRRALGKVAPDLPPAEAEVSPLGEDVFARIADWQHFALLEMTYLADFSPKPKVIARRLGISEAEAEASVELLSSLGLLVAEGATVRKTSRSVHTGMANWFDLDDNGNGILDVFDVDANGDLLNDGNASCTNTDVFFAEGAEWVSATVDSQMQAEGLATVKMKFITKLREGASEAWIVGAPSLLSRALTPTGEAWNGQLFDDGLHEDFVAGDGVFAAVVTLAPGKYPHRMETVFFDLVSSQRLAYRLPYVFAGLDVKPITFQFDPQSNSVLLLGDPFGGEIQDFNWCISAFDAAGQHVWQSQKIPATSRMFAVQENVFQSRAPASISVQAMTVDRFPGYPSYLQKGLSLPVDVTE